MARYIPCWDEDVQRFFLKAPDEFALFYWLLRSAHYKKEPYRTLITGRISKTKDKYKQEWLIERGDILTSKLEISSIWGFHRTRGLKKLLLSLAEKRLIGILLEEPTLIVRIKNFEYFKWAGKSEDRPAFIEEELESAEKVIQMDHIGDPFGSGGDPKNIPADKNEDVFVQNGSQIRIRSRTKKEEGGELARAREEGTPPFLNSLEELEIGEGIEQVDISPLSKTVPPDEAKALLVRWEGRALQRTPNRPFKALQEMTALMKMAKICTFNELHKVLDLLENPIDNKKLAKVSLEFNRPSDHAINFFTEGTRLDVVLIIAREIHAKEEAIRKKKMEEALEKARKDQLWNNSVKAKHAASSRNYFEEIRKEAEEIDRRKELENRKLRLLTGG